jgi:hypothetical protein
MLLQVELGQTHACSSIRAEASHGTLREVLRNSERSDKVTMTADKLACRR